MKLKFLVSFLSVLITGNVFAQKFGYVDTDYILSRMPEYKEAQAEIESLSAAWQNEIQELYKVIDGMYSDLKAEEVLLTKAMYEERQNEIKVKEEEVKEYQKKIFGFDGLFFLKKKELVKPVQDKVFEAVEKISKEHRLAIMFDKAGELVMIYTDPVHDYTDYVLDELELGDPSDQIN